MIALDKDWLCLVFIGMGQMRPISCLENGGVRICVDKNSRSKKTNDASPTACISLSLRIYTTTLAVDSAE